MIWPHLQKGKFLRRYKRFFVDIELENKEIFTVHCPNTGSMKSILDQAEIAWFSISDNPKRKLKGTLEFLVLNSGEWVMVNTLKANLLVREYLERNSGCKNFAYDELKSEVKYGEENSRIDFLLIEQNQKHFVEVKSVTYLNPRGLHSFPDSVSSRGTKHLRELMVQVKQGNKASLVFMINRTEIADFTPASEVDPLYGRTLEEARKAGVEIHFLQIKNGDPKIRAAVEFFAEKVNLRHHPHQENL